MKQEDKTVMEIKDADVVNELFVSGEWCQPIFSEKRNVYIIKRRKK